MQRHAADREIRGGGERFTASLGDEDGGPARAETAGLTTLQIRQKRSRGNSSQDAHTTVAGYYEILEDCLIAERIDR